MNRPSKLTAYPEIDFKLGIKSSLPNVKATLALLMMFWHENNDIYELSYSQESGNQIIIADNVKERLIELYNPIYRNIGITNEQFLEKVNSNQLFKSQLESLIVAFELIWKVAKIKFTANMAASSERSGNRRYNKTLYYTKNMDIIDLLLSTNSIEYKKVLLKWLGFSIEVPTKVEESLINLLAFLSEESIYKLNDGGEDIIFNTNSIYEVLLENDIVDIDGDKEPKGSLRILKSILTDNLNPFLRYSSRQVSVVDEFTKDRMIAYQKRLNTYLGLANMKVLPQFEDIAVEIATENLVETDELIAENIIIYGVPGCGKSHYIKENYTINDDNSERVVFHPDYTYSDFVGQILPQVAKKSPDSDEAIIKYGFVPGPFTRLLAKCENNKDIMHYLVIEEINRGNAPAIFGEIFQLLDRNDNGVSEYGISNLDIAKEIYNDETKMVKIPNNLTILSTMNTADQNVFTLDTAFKRRWEMKAIRNNFKLSGNDANFNAQLEYTLCGTDLTWMKFATRINASVVAQSESNLGSEDKRLGHFFIKLHEMQDVSKFSEKVIMYLWNDVFKFEKDNVFNSNYKTLEDILDAFQEPSIRFKVFADKLDFSEFIATEDNLVEGDTDE